MNCILPRLGHLTFYTGLFTFLLVDRSTPSVNATAVSELEVVPESTVPPPHLGIEGTLRRSAAWRC
jgi:hypothetical protein